MIVYYGKRTQRIPTTTYNYRPNPVVYMLVMLHNTDTVNMTFSVKTLRDEYG